MLRLENNQDFVEIRWLSLEASELPSKGDLYLSIQASSAGFTGHNDLWVLAPVFRSFCRAMLKLEERRQGEARLEAIDSREMTLTVRSVDSWGHMAVEGAIGYQINREHALFWHRVEFGFEFDPGLLAGVTGAGWVRDYAEAGEG